VREEQAVTLKASSYTWVAYRNGYYLCGTLPSNTTLFHGVPVIIVFLVHEERQTVHFWSAPGSWKLLHLALDTAAREFGLGALPEGLTGDHPWGRWYPTKALHPLIARARTAAWSWLRAVETRSDKLVNLGEAKLRLAQGSVRSADGITYEGFVGATIKVHGFDTIARTVAQSVALCKAAWDWEPKHLRVLVHTAGRAMGLAYNPGKGDHRISLNRRLLTDFDTMSLARVVLHELCHHYRDERFPKSADSHDAVFCRELGKVDLVVANDPRGCQFFSDEVWEESTVVQARKTKQAALLKAENYDPEQGMILVRVRSDNRLTWDWIPHSGKGFRRRGVPLSPKHMREAFGSLPSSVKLRIQVAGAERRGQGFVDLMLREGGRALGEMLRPTLWGFLQGLGLFLKPEYKEIAE